MDRSSVEAARSKGVTPSGDGAPPSVREAIELAQALWTNISSVVLGAPGAVTAAVVAALSGNHLLVEDVPGVGKTMLAKALARTVGARMARIQGQPDLLPSDITGVSVYSPASSTWEIRPGPVFAHVLLVDELNRTPPRTQSALLESMEERQVTIDGESLPLPRPHLVLATQNPISQIGTYPLVESQLDRFGLSTGLGYPSEEAEVSLALRHGAQPALDDLKPACAVESWERAQRAVRTVIVAPAVAGYAVRLCRATRAMPSIRLGASPRAAIVLTATAQAHAILAGRDFATPDDVKAVAVACLQHRIAVDSGDGRHAIEQILAATPVPRP